MNTNCPFSVHRITVFALILLILAAPFALGQTSTSGAIRGTLTDPTGAVIPNAIVTVTSQGSGAVRKVKL